jgi:hypothetical protein
MMNVQLAQIQTSDASFLSATAPSLPMHGWGVPTTRGTAPLTRPTTGSPNAGLQRRRRLCPLSARATARSAEGDPRSAEAAAGTAAAADGGHGAEPWARQAATVISKELWETIRLHPNLHWSWVNLPLPPYPTTRQLSDRSWVLEAFHGLELGRFATKEGADRALVELALLGDRRWRL